MPSIMTRIAAASVFVAVGAEVSAVDRVTALQLVQANDLLLGRIAFDLERTEVVGQAARGETGSALFADLARWSLAFEPGRFRMAYEHIPGPTDAELRGMSRTSIGEVDHLIVWQPTTDQAVLQSSDGGIADRAFLPWPSTCPYIAFLPAPAHGRAELGVSALLADESSTFEPYTATDGTTHLLTATVEPWNTQVVVWLDLSGPPTVTRFRMGSAEFRALAFVDVGASRLPAAIMTASVDAWSAFDTSGSFPADSTVLRFDVVSGADGLPRFLLGDAVATVFPPAGATLPESTSVVDMRGVPMQANSMMDDGSAGHAGHGALLVPAPMRSASWSMEPPLPIWSLGAIGCVALCGATVLTLRSGRSSPSASERRAR
jgi:hypothetical protein